MRGFLRVPGECLAPGSAHGSRQMCGPVVRTQNFRGHVMQQWAPKIDYDIDNLLSYYNGGNPILH